MQPNLTAAADGTVSVAFYDRRLACPAAGTKEAAAAGLALDTGLQNAGYTGPVPPFGAANYCVNTSIQFYTSNLNQASRMPTASSVTTSATSPAADSVSTSTKAPTRTTSSSRWWQPSPSPDSRRLG
ncbi:MAG: hypothetical protein E6I33_04050 [Chloroflexi bacterium]|nr:MAG: hypothetical protein E6I33_04050 [Chloroflexota bacterium]